MKDKLPVMWGVGLAFVTFYAFFGRQTVGTFIPALSTEGGWLVSFIALTIALIVALLFANIIEAVADAESGEPGHDGHH